MPTNANEKVRLSVWLACLAPIVAIALVGAYFLTADKKPARRTPPATPVEVDTPAPQAVAPPSAPQRLPVALPSAPATVPNPAGALPGTAGSSAADERREIDALLARPPDSGQWTLEKKKAYWAQLVGELNVRERNLEGDVAAARRSGNKDTEQSKTSTLDYVRRRREALEALIRTAGEPDASP